MNYLIKLVMDGMKWDEKKTSLWFNSKNNLLGGITPNELKELRGNKKLEKFIRQQLDMNKLDSSDNFI